MTNAPDPSEIPWDRLPDGFAEQLRAPGTPATPRPAATVVLMRPGGSEGLELLLLRRVRSAGFVPGAWVFPGGRVDRHDEDPELLRRLGTPSGAAPPSAVVAAIREAFEETGILLARDPDGQWAPSAADDPSIHHLRTELLQDTIDFRTLLVQHDWWMESESVGYIAHWITPEAEPRRYDTYFFAAVVPEGASARIHRAEATRSIWVGPSEALRRHAEGELPMIFPTLKTIESLERFGDPSEVLEHHRDREIPAILPTLVHTPTGVGIRIPDEE